MNSALIVIDVQNGFVNRRSEHVLPNVVAAIEAAVEKGIPVFFTRFLNDPGSAWETLIHWERLRMSPETDLHASVVGLAPDATVVDKHSYTSLIGPIRDAVEKGQFDTIALCGIATDGCVLKTSIDLFEANVRPLILRDAVASHAGDEVHEAGLLLAGRFIGRDQLITIDEWKRLLAS